MGRVIARVAGPQKPEDELIQVLALAFLSITIAFSSTIVGSYLSMALGIITAALFIIMLHRMVVATFTEDGLVIGRGGRRGRVFIPKSVVITGNVICIRRESRELSLRVVYESFDYTIPLASKRVYDRLVNGLATHWGWIPPECPST